MRFTIQIKFSQAITFFSLVTPEGLTNSWSNHYPPVRFLCHGSLFTTPVGLIRTDLSYDLATGGILFHSAMRQRANQCFPYIDHCVARRHRINIERHEFILSFFFYNAIWKSKNLSVH